MSEDKFLQDLLRAALICGSTEDLKWLDSPEHCLAYLTADASFDESDSIAGLRFPIAAGLYQFCSLYHGGQNSRLYQIMSCMHLPPLQYSRHHYEEDGDAAYVFDRLVEWHGDNKYARIDHGAVTGDPLKPQLEDEE